MSTGLTDEIDAVNSGDACSLEANRLNNGLPPLYFVCVKLRVGSINDVCENITINEIVVVCEGTVCCKFSEGIVQGGPK